MVTYTVTTAADVVAADGQLSLREAISLANGAAGADTIVFAAGLAGSTLTLGVAGELEISADLTIDGDSNGDGKADITISGDRDFSGTGNPGDTRIFYGTGGSTDINLYSLTLTGGYGDYGGAINASDGSSLNIVNSTIRDSRSTVVGGGVEASGALTITNSTFSGNTTFGSGGAVRAGNATIVNSTFSDNSSTAGSGGAITLTSGSIINSTIVGNSANNGGGLYIVFNDVEIFNSVLGSNTAPANADVRFNIGGSITAQNSFFGSDVAYTDNGGNLNDAGDPLLGALADNGGTVQTRVALAGSALIDAGDSLLLPNDAADLDGDGNTGEPLPFAANGLAREVGQVDIGAAESNLVLVVDTLVDEEDGDFSAGDLSLREALSIVADGGTITFDAGLAGGTIVLGGTQLDIAGDLIIDGDVNGDDKADITISGDNASRIFDISGLTTDVDLLSLTLTNGSSNDGGAIRAAGINTLDIVNSTISDSASSDDGGGIYLDGAGNTTIINSLLSGNTAVSQGGGIYAYDGHALKVINTTIYDNATNGYGGGVSIYNSNGSFYNSTITNNLADANGSGIGADGGGLDSFNSTLVVTNSVVAGNTLNGVANDVFGSIDIATNSFIGVAATINAYVGGPGATNNGGGDALLDVLGDNGGTVQTQAILVGSDLIGAGNTIALPVDTHDVDNDGDTAENLPTDANGVARVNGLGVMDIGAVESNFIFVDNIIDEDDGDISAGDLSLREALGLAKSGDTILFDDSLAGQTISIVGMNRLNITQNITIDGDIDGDNKADVTISGGNSATVFGINAAGIDVNLLSLTLTDGNANGAFGGAISASGFNSLNIIDTTISNSTANYGGAISLSGGGTTTITNSLVTGNQSTARGGGIYALSSHNLNLVNSTIFGNSADGAGGGLAAGVGVVINVTDSTIAGNQADADGATTFYGGGVRASGGLVHFNNSVVAQNTSGMANVADDFSGNVASANNSFFGTLEAISAGAGNTVDGGDPLLGELLNNGGTTLTLSPLDGSALIGAGSNGVIGIDSTDLDQDGNTVEVLPIDGRGGARIVGGTVDIGAVEQIVDEVIGGTAGDDNIVGGLGNDTATYEDASAGVTQYLLFTGLDTGGAGTDTLSGIENLTGSAFDDRLIGDGNDNVLSGGDGVDILKGKGGNDTFFGGDGDDKLTGSAGNDTMFGGAGNDTLIALAGVDTLNGGDDNDFLFGGKDSDTLNGDAGADNIRGNLGVDVLNGGAGDDTLRGGGSNDIVNGDAGDDIMFGENHADTLFGGAGNDSMSGGSGGGVGDGFTDTFIYKDTGDGGGGFDRIKDFENGIDVMDLQSFGFADFAAVQALTSNSGLNMRINFGGGDVLFVENFQVVDFDVGDVII